MVATDLGRFLPQETRVNLDEMRSHDCARLHIVRGSVEDGFPERGEQRVCMRRARLDN